MGAPTDYIHLSILTDVGLVIESLAHECVLPGPAASEERRTTLPFYITGHLT